jgi:hypothetical protein
MKPSRSLLRNRKAEYMARDLLRDRGYDVVRSAGTDSPVDLVAWKDDGSVLFVRTARSRRSFEGVGDLSFRFRREIATLRRIPGRATLSVEFWVYFDHEGWRVFSVYRNGMVEAVG